MIKEGQRLKFTHPMDSILWTPDVEKMRIWLLAALTPNWGAWGLYLPGSHGWHLAELKILPFKLKRVGEFWEHDLSGYAPGEWSRDPSVLEEMSPPQEVYSRLLRLVPLSEMNRTAQAAGADLRQLQSELVDLDTPFSGRDFPPPGLTAAQLRNLEVAVAYIAEVRKSARDPSGAVAKKLGLSGPIEVRDRLKAARRFGFLTSAGPGRTGGELTPLGAEYAASHLTKAGRIRRRGRPDS